MGNFLTKCCIIIEVRRALTTGAEVPDETNGSKLYDGTFDEIDPIFVQNSKQEGSEDV